MGKEQNKVINQAIPAVKIRLKPVAKMIFCKCKCGQKRLSHDSQGRPRSYIKGHYSRGRSTSAWHLRGQSHPGWKGGRYIQKGYTKILRPDHRRADGDGYVFEHIIKYEEYHNCCLLKWAVIHHRDRNRQNNSKDNLEATSRSKHNKTHHSENRTKIFDRMILCPKCDDNYVVKGGVDGELQVFICRGCGNRWETTKDDYSKKHSLLEARRAILNQTCPSCNSKHVRRCGSQSNKQRFACISCKKTWYGLIQGKYMTKEIMVTIVKAISDLPRFRRRIKKRVGNKIIERHNDIIDRGIKYPKCSNLYVVKCGRENNSERYLCRGCGKEFGVRDISVIPPIGR